MLGIRLVIMIGAFLGLESLPSGISCSGLRTLRTKMCFGSMD